MYAPKHFSEKEMARLLDLIRANSFGMLISVNEGVPFISHIPMLVTRRDEEVSIRGHLARANEQWQHFEADSAARIVFQGPHSYISPTWYENGGVPTWNYTAVHASGRIRLIHDEATLHQLVVAQSNFYEQKRLDPWQPDYDLRKLRGIVGFEMVVTQLQGKFKLSQNRSLADRARVIEQLQKHGSAEALGVATLMLENLDNN